MRKQYAIDRLKAAGYNVTFTGRLIEASKNGKTYKGSPNSVFIEIFNYNQK